QVGPWCNTVLGHCLSVRVFWVADQAATYPSLAQAFDDFNSSAPAIELQFLLRPNLNVLDELSGTRQDNRDLSKLAKPCINFYCTSMLFDDDVVADGKAEASAFPRRLGREERLEHLFFHVRRDASPIIPNPDFHAITKTFSRSRKSRFVVATIDFRS